MGCVATEQPNGSFTWRNGLLLYKGRVVIPNDATLRATLLHEMHDTKVGGHSGVLRTFKKLVQQFYWPGMHKAVQNYVKECEICQKTKAETLALAGLLQPLSIPCQVWDDITLDFIEGLPVSQGRDTIMVIVNRLSKFAHFLTLYTTRLLQKLWQKNLLKALSSSMECPSPLSVIRTPFSSAISGKSSSRCLVPNFGSVQ